MAVAATGSLSLSLEHLRATIAASATFRAVVGATDADDALRFIHKFRADDRDPTQGRPRCVVDYGGAQEGDGSESFSEVFRTGPMLVYFEFPTDARHADDRRDAGTDFTNKIGAIQTEMQDARLSRPNLYLNIVRWVLLGIDREDETVGRIDAGQEAVSDFWWADFEVHWEGM